MPSLDEYLKEEYLPECSDQEYDVLLMSLEKFYKGLPPSTLSLLELDKRANSIAAQQVLVRNFEFVAPYLSSSQALRIHTLLIVSLKKSENKTFSILNVLSESIANLK